MPDADTVWLTPLREVLDCLDDAGLVIRWQEDCSQSHSAMADALHDAFVTDGAQIAAEIGHRALQDLLDAHQLWSNWLRSTRVRKLGFVTEKTGVQCWSGSHHRAARCHTSERPMWRRRAARAEKGSTMQTDTKIAVTGATGRVGSPLVEILEQRGHEVVPIARSQGVDVVSGEGLDEALAGVETIIDAATGPSPEQAEATAFFTASARNLQRAGSAAGAKRIVLVSIIGIDKFHGGYNAAKVAQERTLLEGPLPVRIVRAAQFHEFVEPLVGWTIQDGVAYVPEMRTQLVAARVVAETLADAAEEPEIQNGRITEVAGPREERLANAAAALFASRGDSIEVREGRGGPLAAPDDPDAAAYAEGAALPGAEAKLAGPSFEGWLAAAKA
jgi:uncharacterized protein YbjT (DUF2867 family)